MPQDKSKGPAGETAQERASRKQADDAIRKEMDRRDRLLLGQIQEIKAVTLRLAEATSFQFSLENSLQEISNKLTPIEDLSPKPAKLDEDQAYALDRIRSELARAPDAKMYLVEGAGRGLGGSAS